MTNFDPETLNFIHQDVSFQLECALVLYELSEELCLQAEVLVTDLSAQANINLNDDYRLVIRPINPGFNGANTWFKWQELKHPSSGNKVAFSQLRCLVELQFFVTEAQEHKSLMSFGVDAQNLQQVIQKALTKVSQHCGLRLVALPQTKLNTATN